jgi:diacylglycerol kinase family enzyme
MKKLLGPLEYIIAGLKAAAEPAPQLEIEANHTRLEGSFVVIGNGRLYGGPFALFPKASNDDGKLDVCVFQGSSYLDFLRYFQGVVRGVHTDFPDVKYLSVPRVRVTSARQVPMEADGELLGHTPAEFDLWPKALRVLVP